MFHSVTPATTKLLLFCTGVVLLVGITLFQSRFYLYGPVIEIAQDNLVSQEPSIIISFIVTNASEVVISGKEVIPQISGLVTEELFLQPGHNVFTIIAKDNYGSVESKNLYITYPQ